MCDTCRIFWGGGIKIHQVGACRCRSHEEIEAAGLFVARFRLVGCAPKPLQLGASPELHVVYGERNLPPCQMPPQRNPVRNPVFVYFLFG
jgi:hypothetical protein